jgi:hypothetical protein
MNEQRRSGDFIERISIILVVGAFIGGFIVLLDVRFVLTIFGQTIQIGQNGFAPEVKGMVLQSMLISGFAAVVGYWLGTTKQGQDQAQSVNKIAEMSAPAQAVAVAAARAPVPEVPIAPALETPADK